MVDDSLSGSETGGWELLEVLAVVILAAESLRIAGSLASGLIYASTAHAGAFGQQELVGSAMERAANFADGPGIVLLLVSLALLWWRTEVWTRRVRQTAQDIAARGSIAVETIQVRRLRYLAHWASGMFALASIGAVAFLVGDLLVNTAGGVPASDQWQSYATDAFSAAYIAIAVAGTLASAKLAKLCDVDMDRIEAMA